MANTNSRPTALVGQYRSRAAALAACVEYATPDGKRWAPVANGSKWSIQLVRDVGRVPVRSLCESAHYLKRAA